MKLLQRFIGASREQHSVQDKQRQVQVLCCDVAQQPTVVILMWAYWGCHQGWTEGEGQMSSNVTLAKVSKFIISSKKRQNYIRLLAQHFFKKSNIRPSKFLFTNSIFILITKYTFIKNKTTFSVNQLEWMRTWAAPRLYFSVDKDVQKNSIQHTI